MLLTQQLLAGVASGVTYALLGLALVMVHRSSGVVNFAQAAMATLSAYVALSLVDTGLSPVTAVALAVLLSLPFGAAVDRVLIRRFERADQLVTVMVTVGLLVTIEGVISFVWGDASRRFPSMFPAGVVSVGETRVPLSVIGAAAVLTGVLVTLHLLFHHTRTGLALRAVAADRRTTALLGLDVNRLLMLGWALGAALGALAAALAAPVLFLEPGMMTGVLVYALAAAVLGGLDSPLGTVVAALALGVGENLAGTYVPGIGNDLKIVLPLVVLSAVLLLRPHGWGGSPAVDRV